MRVFAALAACVLAVGLPRLLVACTSDGHGSHLEWLHAEGACCAHEHHAHHEGTAADDLPRGVPRHETDESCEHVDLAIDVGPIPRAELPALPPPAVIAVLAVLPEVATARREGRFGAPATGPPRRDAPVQLRSTTLLRS